MIKSIISAAPMLDWTDRHCRYLFRLLSKHCVLYSEMITTGAILYGDTQRFLKFNKAEHPVVLQLGGSDPIDLARCAIIAAQYGYDEINLNVGCPSDRVQSGRFGACLMAEPELVAQCIKAMQEQVQIPVTVKTRLGIDERDSYAELVDFIGKVAAAGCQHFIMHARKAWLKGLSPKENREIPPLNYDAVYQLKKDFPHLQISINGGIKTVAEIQTHLQHVDGVMIGRQAYHEPYLLAEIDHVLHESPLLSRHEIALQYMEYVEQQLAQDVPLSAMTRHILNLFHAQPGARLWRRYLTEQVQTRTNDAKIIEKALEFC